MLVVMTVFFRQGQMLLISRQAAVATVSSGVTGQQHAIGSRRSFKAIVGIGLLGMEIESK